MHVIHCHMIPIVIKEMRCVNKIQSKLDEQLNRTTSRYITKNIIMTRLICFLLLNVITYRYRKIWYEC